MKEVYFCTRLRLEANSQRSELPTLLEKIALIPDTIPITIVLIVFK